MTSLRVIRRDVMAEFMVHAAPLDRNGKLAAKHIFDTTIKPFHARATKQSPPVDVWAIKKFRGFILNETRKIAVEANRAAVKSITASVLNAAAVKVMTKTQKVCQVLIRNGKLHLTIGTLHGEVCSGFLATQT